MIGEISQIDLAQLRLLLQRGWIRRISSVHIHHTWRPNHSQWSGKSTVEAIRRFHVEDMHWSDIAEHLTIGPDGSIWTGRHLDRPPASIAGHNGTATEGPFMIEMIGDFDAGQDTFGGAQADCVYQTVAEICARFQLNADAIRFHNEFTNAKTCPGTSLNLTAFRNAVTTKRKRVAPIAVNADARAYAMQIAPADVATRASESADAELRYDAQQAARSWTADGADRGFGAQFSAQEIEIFRSHVIDLSHGQLSDGGAYQNSEADLDELIARLDRWRGTVAAGVTPHVVFFAHGGLVNEKGGLGIAIRDHHWWLANGVYPIFFVWETGFMEVFSKAREMGDRALSSDDILEVTLGPTVGRPTWDRIKDGAFLASSARTGTGGPGGAAVFASKLATWLSTLPNANTLRFHAAGHSAGSIFHCHYLPALEAAFQSAGIATREMIATLAFLAPAVRVDLFKQMLLPRVGAGQSIAKMAMFTMFKHDEKADNVAAIYHKSLLYFVCNGCERPTHSTPILGLEESVRADANLPAFFGLGVAGPADVIWSPTSGAAGNASSKAIHHGDFDEDSPTMNSVMSRVLGLANNQPVPCPHVTKVRDVTDRSLDPTSRATIGTAARRGTAAMNALCIGIDSYGPQSLNGCVADSQSFVDTLSRWGFAVQHLTNERATREGITSAIDAMLAQSNDGDVVVIQYAGHGTQLEDLSGDESDGYDEAWVPYDYTAGEFVIDDDLGALFDRHRDRGIQLVIFADCCHSGTSTRFFPARGEPQNLGHSRYMQVPRDIVERFRNKRGMSQSGARFGTQDGIGWEVHFAACQDRQSAYEHDGHGDFTQAATRALDAALGSPTSYAALAAVVAQQFSGNALQTPTLRALSDLETRTVFSMTRALTKSQGGTNDMDLGRRIDRLTIAIDALAKKVAEL